MIANIVHPVFVCTLFPEKMAQNIRDEITRLHRRKQLSFSYNNALERMQDSESSGSEMGPDSPRRPDTPPNVVRNPEKGLFTFKQVSEVICIHLLMQFDSIMDCLIFRSNVLSHTKKYGSYHSRFK